MALVEIVEGCCEGAISVVASRDKASILRVGDESWMVVVASHN